MIRIFESFYYTLEFLIATAVFLIVLSLYIKKIERKSLLVFNLAGLINSGVELLLQGIGIRTIENAYFFTIPIGFPYIPLILGFYEGGLKTLVGYHFVLYFIDKKKINGTLLILLLCLVFVPFFIYSAFTAYQIKSGTTNITLTARNMFALLSILLLILSFSLSILYFVLNKKIPKKNKLTLLYYEIGVVIYLLAWMVPMHIYLLRYIGIKEDGSYVLANIVVQLLLMYGYFLFFEGVGVNIIIYPLIYHFNLIQFEKLGK
jgi:hypothetical protein